MNHPRRAPSAQQRGGVGTGVPVDFVVRFGHVLSSSLTGGARSAVQLFVAGLQGVDYTDPSNPKPKADGERNDAASMYGALGLVGRPLDGDKEDHHEVVCLVTSDGLIPIAHRDLRLQMGGSAPQAGVIGLVGYGGGFYSLTPSGAKGANGTLHTAYCPYSFQQGVAQKAHAVVMDPTPGNESVSVVHGDGMAVTMSDGKLVLKSASGAAHISISDGEITIFGSVKIVGGLRWTLDGITPGFPVALIGAPGDGIPGHPPLPILSGGPALGAFGQ